VSLRSTAVPGQAFNYARNDRRAGCSGSGDDVAGAGKSTSAPGAIAQALKDDLLDGAIAPGTRLTEEALSTRFGCGRHTVRSGLQILVSEGLLAHERNKGIIVPPVTEERVDAMCSYRLILAMGALRLALVVGADFSEVSRAVEHLVSLTEETAWRHVIEAHSAVHRRSSRPAATRAWSPHIGPVRTSST